VAPNVAGSIPVAHPRFLQCLSGDEASRGIRFKSSTSPKCARYEIYGLDRGVVYVNLDKGTAGVMDDKSRCAKESAKRQARTARIAEAKIAKAAKNSLA
jgi:hypothetical protein